ncbi:hypothetical protein [Tropicimonas sediminicola]|uniref:Uncharacterized protein n=1 Tax=Tropicimonas sediminicola TaxID=1031541 RepID=A0A239GMY4_9RHOB|nr:hypothetical protein [Tropicimonas sediminicola]SNS70559.1 hypothetical protein SAMN05421757_10330 [Tropicimonas sediminicola]
MASETAGTATVHYPGFITEPGSPDVLFNVVVIFVLVLVFLIGAFYFRLHALPEQMAHSKSPAQYQLVAILALIGLFTHNNLFWIGALLLAAISIPDFLTPLRSIATSLQKMSGSELPEPREQAHVTRDTRAAATDFVDRDEWEGKDV